MRKYYRILVKLIELGLNINIQDDLGETPLLKICKHHILEMVRILEIMEQTLILETKNLIYLYFICLK